MAPYEYLETVIQNDHKGDALGFEQSLDLVIGRMEANLEDIIAGQWNGRDITDTSQIGSYLQQELDPVLEAAAALMNCATQGEGWTDAYPVPSEARDVLGGTTCIDLLDAEEKVKGAVVHWLAFVGKHPDLSQPGLPLPANHGARHGGFPKIDSLSDVLTQTSDGYRPLGFVSDEDARTHPDVSAPNRTRSHTL